MAAGARRGRRLGGQRRRAPCGRPGASISRWDAARRPSQAAKAAAAHRQVPRASESRRCASQAAWRTTKLCWCPIRLLVALPTPARPGAVCGDGSSHPGRPKECRDTTVTRNLPPPLLSGCMGAASCRSGAGALHLALPFKCPSAHFVSLGRTLDKLTDCAIHFLSAQQSVNAGGWWSPRRLSSSCTAASHTTAGRGQHLG